MIKNKSRIVIVGTGCSGKTTLARKLAGILSIPHIQLDAIHWKPDWESRPRDEFRQLTREAVNNEQWVTDGNYSVVRDIVWDRATALIWLNYSFPTVLWRAIARTSQRAILKKELFSGNRESIRQAFFSTDSMILWVIKSHHSKRKRYLKILKEPEFSHLEVMVLKDQKETDALVLRIKDQIET
jgi:adenylate kinase family enzyme